MPKTTVTVKEKTRQKTANSRSPFENGASSKPVDESDASDVEIEADGVETEKIREKDEVEKKLERMLFGDDEGFVGALKSQDRDLMALMAKSDEENGSEEDECDDFDDRDLSDVADADVRSSFPRWSCACANRIPYSSSSSILALHRLLLSFQRLRRRGPTPRKTQKRRRRIARCGMIATMSA